MNENIVVIGGGTGQGNLLEGLKKFTDNITAIVTVADDGGGSGLIRSENRMLPPGDIRNCLLSLSNTDELTEKLLRHRFESGSIKNQSFGNLLILAYFEIFKDFEKSIDYVGKIIGAKGKVVPSTREHIRLVAKLSNDNVVIGESNIANMSIMQKSEIKKLELLPSSPKATESALNAINNADKILIGPGSLYTSIIANLLIPEIREGIINSNAKKFFICNIMSERGETDGLDVFSHYNKIISHIEGLNVDFVLVNNKKIVGDVAEKYNEENKSQVLFDDIQRYKFNSLGVTIIEDDFAKVTDYGHIVHDSEKVSKVVLGL